MKIQPFYLTLDDPEFVANYAQEMIEHIQLHLHKKEPFRSYPDCEYLWDRPRCFRAISRNIRDLKQLLARLEQIEGRDRELSSAEHRVLRADFIKRKTLT
jgi:hypothetical protein